VCALNPHCDKDSIARALRRVADCNAKLRVITLADRPLGRQDRMIAAIDQLRRIRCRG
jgi:predicted protein tyrosine phosphatase